MRLVIAILLALSLPLSATAADDLTTKASKYSVKETVDRLTGALKDKGISPAARIDHAAAAKAAGLELKATEVLNHVRRLYGDFEYQAGSWDKPRRVLAKVEWHPSELFPRVGFLVTNLPFDPEQGFASYNQRGTAEQYIKEGKMALKWTRLSCRTMAQNEVRLQLHALAYNLGMFPGSADLRTRSPYGR